MMYLRALLLLLAISFFPGVVVLAQDDDTLEYIHGLPETEEDSQQVPQNDFRPFDHFVDVGVEQVPRELLETLNREPQYKGWQNHVLQFDRNTKIYWLHIKDGRTTRSYGFNSDGKEVSVTEKSTSQQE